MIFWLNWECNINNNSETKYVVKEKDWERHGEGGFEIKCKHCATAVLASLSDSATWHSRDS